MFVQLFWDDLPGGNVEHIALRGVTQEEFEDIYFNDLIPTEFSDSTGRPTKAGVTSTGKFVRIVWEEEEGDPGDPLIIIPVTVFFPDDPLV
ncbi:MAG: hypothetical protein J2P46_01330 [Zavarzinella sp.]|nr:hypothetical protein [Zavarzinella sp.]